MNIGKTQITICGDRHTLSCIDTCQIDIDGERLVCEPVIKDLGVYLDQHMIFSTHVHVDHQVHQMSGTLCYISHYRYFLTENATCLLVDLLFLSELSYCSVVWGSISQTDVNQVQKVVNFAARVIYNKKNKNLSAHSYDS